MTTTQAELLPATEPGMVRAVLDPGHTYLREHRVQGRCVLPGVVWLELAVRAGQRPRTTVAGIMDAAWLRPVHGDEPLDELALTLSDAAGDAVDYTVTNRGRLCGMGTLRYRDEDRAPAVPLAVRDRICEHTRSHLTRSEIYTEFAAMGIDYGPYFRRITYVQRHEQTSLAWLSHNDGTRLDLVNLLDCSFQAGMAISIGEHRDSLMPYSMGHMAFHVPPRTPVTSAFVLTVKHSPFRTSLTVYDEDYAPLISVYDLGVKPAIREGEAR